MRRAGVDFAGGADPRGAFEKDVRVNHRVGADLDIGVDVGRGGIDRA